MPAAGNLFFDTTFTLAGTSAADTVVANYLSYYNSYNDYIKENPLDSIGLVRLCNLCPKWHGDVVYQARTLYTDAYGISSYFNDDSLCNIEGLLRKVFDTSETVGRQRAFSLFPNPNAGSFSIKAAEILNETVQVRVYNNLGMVIYSRQRNFENGKMVIEMPEAVPGVYLVCIQTKASTVCLRFVKHE